MRVCVDGASLQWPKMIPLGRCWAVSQHDDIQTNICSYLYISVFVLHVQTWASLASCLCDNSQTESWKNSFRNQITVGSDRVSCQCRFAAQVHSYHRCVDLTVALNEQLQDAVHPDRSIDWILCQCVYLLFSLCQYVSLRAYVMDMHGAELLAWLTVCTLTTSGTLFVFARII